MKFNKQLEITAELIHNICDQLNFLPENEIPNEEMTTLLEAVDRFKYLMTIL